MPWQECRSSRLVVIVLVPALAVATEPPRGDASAPPIAAARRPFPYDEIAHVGIAGHSEGANVAAIAAAKSKDVAFIVLLAGTALPGDEILNLQRGWLEKQAGATDIQIAESKTLWDRAYAIIKAEKDDATASDAVARHLRRIARRHPRRARAPRRVRRRRKITVDAVVQDVRRARSAHIPGARKSARTGAQRRDRSPGARVGEPARDEKGADARPGRDDPRATRSQSSVSNREDRRAVRIREHRRNHGACNAGARE